jgi:hypothetical protein
MLGVTLYAHQCATIDWAASRDCSAVFGEAGVGKTPIGLGWLEKIGTRRALWLTWAPYVPAMRDEVRKFTPFYAPENYDPRAPWRSTGTVWVMSYDRARIERNQLALAGFDAVVADEVDCIKRIQAKRTRAVIKSLAAIPRRMVMTGTPITQNLFDVWSIYLFLDGGRTFGRSYIDFRTRYFYEAGFEWKPKAWALAEIIMKMRVSTCTLVKSECLELPPVVRKLVPVKPNPKTLAAYRAMARNFLAEVGTQTVSTKWATEKTTRMAQMLSGQTLDDLGAKIELPSSKLQTAKVLIPQLVARHTRLVVWCRFRFEVDMLADALGPRLVTGRVYGDSDATREIANWRAAPKGVLIATLAKGSRAFDFTAAPAMLYYNRDGSVAKRVQSLERINRIGAERHEQLVIYDMYTEGTLEESGLEKLEAGANELDRLMTSAALKKYLRVDA